MAKKQQQPVDIDFAGDIDQESVARAREAIAGGRRDPLKAPKDAVVSTDKHGNQYSRWNERVQIVSAHRERTESGLQRIVVRLKVRQSPTEANNGRSVFAEWYRDQAIPCPDNHIEMNDRSNGAIISLLTVTGFMPAKGSLKVSILSKMFPPKGKPGTDSPLNGREVIANLVQKFEPKKNKNGEFVLDDEGEKVWVKRDNAESFLPDAPQVDDTEDAESDDEDEN